MADPTIPEGFTPLIPGGQWLTHAGPIYQRPGPHGTVIVALRVDKQHTNMRGIAHGGMLVTLADSALGRNMNLTRKTVAAMVSVNLSTDFIGAAKVGDWLEAHVEVRKHGARLSFANASCVWATRWWCAAAACSPWWSRWPQGSP